MRLFKLPRPIIDFAGCFSAKGKSCYIVGGALRDHLLGRPVHDYDTATDALPEEVRGYFKRVVPTGIKHGTVTVLWQGYAIETTTFRRDIGYSDGRRPDAVEFGAALEEDLERRDFTINAMAYDPLKDELVDLHGGREDLEARIIRAVGDPSRRFEEDGLRALRAIRFAAQLGFGIDAATLAAIPPALGRLSGVSPERVREEFDKILLSQSPSLGLRLMEGSGVLEALFPEIARCRGVEQKGMHRFDVLDHLYASLDAAPRDLELRLAALLHDLGKVDTKALGADGVPTFYRHEEVSAAIATAFLRRYRYPNATIARVVHLIEQHMFFYEAGWSDAAVRRFIRRVGEADIEALFELRLADATGTEGLAVDPRSLDPLRERIRTILAASQALGLRDLDVKGEDLAGIGVPRGPVMGKILAELLETVLEDPEINTRERLLFIASKLLPRYGIGEGADNRG